MTRAHYMVPLDCACLRRAAAIERNVRDVRIPRRTRSMLTVEQRLEKMRVEAAYWRDVARLYRAEAGRKGKNVLAPSRNFV